MPTDHLSLLESTALATPALDDPALYINRELSWLQFNWRVLDEALQTSQPLLERVKFLAIFAKNLDEFFMIRVAGLRRLVRAGVSSVPPDGMTPAEQLAAIHTTLETHLAQQAACWHQDLLPQLQTAGIKICAYNALQPTQRVWARQLFQQDIFPQLTPLAFDPTHPFPHMANLSLNLAVVVHTPESGERFARVKMPDTLPRFVRVPAEETIASHAQVESPETPPDTFVWLETVVAANLDLLFPDVTIIGSYPFRITRDADIEIRDDEASDLMSTMEAQLEHRDFGSTLRLELAQDIPESVRAVLMRNLRLEPADVYTSCEPLGLGDVMELTRIERPDLKDRP
jgi:polyphosphate kinase